MSRTYELVFIADPRLSDEDVVGLTDEVKSMVEGAGGSLTKEESWGRRKLAFPIKKFNEGKYVVLYIDADAGHGLAEVEQRLEQNDRVLRYLLVRTDLDLKRAASKGKQKPASDAAPSGSRATSASG